MEVQSFDEVDVKNHVWMSLLAALFVLAHSAPATPCTPPEPRLQVIATTPADGAEDVRLDQVISMQFRVTEDYSFGENFGIYANAPYSLTITDDEGVVHAQTETEVEVPVDFANHLAKLIVEVDDFAPEQTYFAALERNGVSFEWSFTTGNGMREPTQVGRIDIDLDTYFARRPVTRCCQTEFAGQCPTCYDIGDEPVAAISARVTLPPHEQGPGAWTYELESRLQGSQEWHVEARTASSDISSDSTIFEVQNDRFRRQNSCYRVIAHSILQPPTRHTSDEICIDGTDVFAEPPTYEIDPSRAMCGADDIDEEVDEDDEVEEDETVDDDDIEVEDSEDPPIAVDGRDQIDWGGSARESDGCGCSSASRGEVPGALLLLLAFLGLSRRNRRL